jgi:lycopene beta-cyclase
MGNRTNPDLIIAGGGIAGCLLLAAVRQRMPSLRVELHEARDALAGNHTWSFHEADIPSGARDWLEPLISRSWPGYEVFFPLYGRRLPTAYHAIRSEDLRSRIMERFSDSICLNSDVDLAQAQSLVIDCGGWPRSETPSLQGYQKFVGLEVELESSHGLAEPILKDVRVEQTDGYRFFYLLPWNDKSLLVEDTYYSNTPDLSVANLDAGIRNYIQERGWKIARVHRREIGCLPLPVDPAQEPSSKSRGLSIGAASGIFNPVTGYTLPQTLACIQAVVGTDGVDPRLWRQALEKVRKNYEGQFRYLRFLNRMMFLAAEPTKRYVILERFYQLSEGLIGRFYSARLKPWDRMRILIGKPPVPVRKALLLLKHY